MAGHGPTSPSDPARSWGLVLLTAVVVAALAAPVVVAVVARLHDDSSATAATEPVATPTRAPSPSPSPTPATPSATPSASPTPTATATPTQTTPPVRRGATCWDGSQARHVTDCTDPQGVPGLTWVFPGLKGQRCGHPGQVQQRGLVLRILCRARLRDGTPVVLGYAQWQSVGAARAYFHHLGLAPSKQTGRGGEVVGYRYLGHSRSGQKVAGLYAAEPYSVAIDLPSSADAEQAYAQVVRARPAGQVRGEPDR